MPKTNSTNSVAFFSAFGFALTSGYSLLSLNGDDRDEGIDPSRNTYRGGGLFRQTASNLDGRFDADEADGTYELRVELFDDGAWHDDDGVTYTRGIEDGGETDEAEIVLDRYSRTAEACGVRDGFAAYLRNKAVVCRNTGTRFHGRDRTRSFHGTDDFYQCVVAAAAASVPERRQVSDEVWLKPSLPERVSTTRDVVRTTSNRPHRNARIVQPRG